MGLVGRIGDFFKGIVTEMKKVNWPTRRETIYLTLIVIVSLGVAAAFIMAIDFGLSKILEYIIHRG